MVQAAEPTVDTLVPPTIPDATAPTAIAAAQFTPEAAGPGAEAASPTYDLSSEDGVRAAIAAHEALRKAFTKQQDDGFQAGRQNRDKELRLERGTEETARAYQEHLAEKYGIELDEADRREAPLWVRAARDTERATYWQTTSEAVLDAFSVTERESIRAAYAQFEGLPDQMEQIGRQVIDEAVKRQTQTRVSTLALDDIPKDSALWKAVDAHVTSEVEKELAARLAEKSPVDNPPRTPVGAQASTRTQADYARFTPEQIAVLPDAEYRIAMGFPG